MPPGSPLWLVCNASVRHTPRVAAVWSFLEDPEAERRDAIVQRDLEVFAERDRLVALLLGAERD